MPDYINRPQFLSRYGIKHGTLIKEINELISNWHKMGDVAPKPNAIHQTLVPHLEKAVPYWKNLNATMAEGFQDKNQRTAFHKLLFETITKNGTINYFGILCPSYKKGVGATGFASKPGSTTKRAFANLERMVQNTEKLGISCNAIMLFADISIENPQLLTEQDWLDFQNIIDQDELIAKSHNIPYATLTEFYPDLKTIVGRDGKIVDVSALPISEKALERSMWRDRQFYPTMFGWSTEQAEARTIVHAHSYYWQGVAIREKLKYPVMVYSAYDYEKGGLYNGPDGSLWPSVIYPKKVDNNPETATIPKWE